MSGEQSEAKVNIEDELDALFKLPLTEFTVARNALATRLKKTGRGDEAQRVKALVKPSISAWAVNQLYWKHRDAFDRLTATGERFTRAQASQLAGKNADTRGPLAERRDALLELSRLAGALLRDARHNPTPDTMRRITTTLEALSTGSSLSDAPSAGRLTDDIGPPGFESLAAFIPGIEQPERRESTRVIPFKLPARTGADRREEERQSRIATAKAALQSAERTLHETRTMAQDLAAALKEATEKADETEKNRREAEERFEQARVAAGEARQRLQTLTAEAARAARLLQDAVRALAKAQEDVGNLEKLP
jgi:hypothetical protein